VRFDAAISGPSRPFFPPALLAITLVLPGCIRMLERDVDCNFLSDAMDEGCLVITTPFSFRGLLNAINFANPTPMGPAADISPYAVSPNITFTERGKGGLGVRRSSGTRFWHPPTSRDTTHPRGSKGTK
jgi:hypothetical protein